MFLLAPGTLALRLDQLTSGSAGARRLLGCTATPGRTLGFCRFFWRPQIAPPKCVVWQLF
jgi:hypothetical protein